MSPLPTSVAKSLQGGVKSEWRFGDEMTITNYYFSENCCIANLLCHAYSFWSFVAKRGIPQQTLGNGEHSSGRSGKVRLNRSIVVSFWFPYRTLWKVATLSEWVEKACDDSATAKISTCLLWLHTTTQVTKLSFTFYPPPPCDYAANLFQVNGIPPSTAYGKPLPINIAETSLTSPPPPLMFWPIFPK